MLTIINIITNILIGMYSIFETTPANFKDHRGMHRLDDAVSQYSNRKFTVIINNENVDRLLVYLYNLPRQ